MNDMRYEVFRGTVDPRQFYWRLVARNGRKIAISGEGYHNEADARHAIDLVRGSPDIPIKFAEK